MKMGGGRGGRRSPATASNILELKEVRSPRGRLNRQRRHHSELTATGTHDMALLPSPSPTHEYPKPSQSLVPQHTTPPPRRTAHANLKPTPTPVASVRPKTGRGIAELAFVPFPSCPKTPSPQQSTWPPVNNAQVVQLSPAEIAATPPRPATGTGPDAPLMVPFPSCPCVLFPKQHLGRRPVPVSPS
jgi:hypothetical protein